MNKRFPLILTSALVASVAIVGCKKKEEPVVAPVATTPAPVATPPAPAAPAAATASVTSVDLGTAVGPDSKISTPATAFKPADTIYASVATTTSDPAANVPGKLAAKWTYDNKGTPMTVNEESKEVNFTNANVTTFTIKKPDGFPAGNYKVEVSLDGKVVQTKEFTVAK